MSQYISNLNMIPAASDVAAQQVETDFNLEADLALFTNANAWEFDMSEPAELPPSIDYDPIQEEKARRQNASAFKNTGQELDFLNGNAPLIQS